MDENKEHNKRSGHYFYFHEELKEPIKERNQTIVGDLILVQGEGVAEFSIHSGLRIKNKSNNDKGRCGCRSLGRSYFISENLAQL